jgi:site-specific DNA-methyltransferase (adenine-specific)
MSAARGKDRRLLSLNLARNARQQMDGVELLSRIPDRIARLVIFDPQYRTGLDQLKFGNEGSRQKARYRLPQMADDTIAFMVDEAERILKPSGHLALWVDKFSIGAGQHLKYLRRARHLRVVDLIAWNKMDIGMGRRARCVTEFLVIAQKAPQIAKGIWTDHRMTDCWAEGRNPNRHPHAKPHILTDRLIRAVTIKGELVVDPCAGGYGVLDACRLNGREFIGCDLLGGDDA